MSSSVSTVAEFVSSGGIHAGVTRWRDGGDGSGGRAQVQRWLDRNYPNLSTNQKRAIIERIRQTREAGRQVDSIREDVPAKSSQFSRQSRGQDPRDTPNLNVHHYYVEYTIKYKDSNGDDKTQVRYKLFKEGKPLEKAALRQRFMDDLDNIMQYESFLYQGKARAHVWTGAHEIDVSTMIVGAWIQHTH